MFIQRAYKEKRRRGQLTSVTSHWCTGSAAIHNHVFFLSLNVRNPFRKRALVCCPPAPARPTVSCQKQSAPRRAVGWGGGVKQDLTLCLLSQTRAQGGKGWGCTKSAVWHLVKEWFHPHVFRSILKITQSETTGVWKRQIIGKTDGKKKLETFKINDSFTSLTVFPVKNAFAQLETPGIKNYHKMHLYIAALHGPWQLVTMQTLALVSELSQTHGASYNLWPELTETYVRGTVKMFRMKTVTKKGHKKKKQPTSQRRKNTKKNGIKCDSVLNQSSGEVFAACL